MARELDDSKNNTHGIISSIYSSRNYIYNSKQRKIFGRDAEQWAKLGLFYFSFYFGLAGFFCALLWLHMVFIPQDIPRYYGESSCMRSRSHLLAPGLGFRPQIDPTKDLIHVNRSKSDVYVRNLHQFLQKYYWKQKSGNLNKTKMFTIPNAGECTPENYYGFSSGRPCILVKMNKIVDFVPKPGYSPEDEHIVKPCGDKIDPNSIAIHCEEGHKNTSAIHNITYISEKGFDQRCGFLDVKWFPYRGKLHRGNVYQAPYIWVQFNRVTPNKSINVVCRLFAANIVFDKSSKRGMTSFEIKVDDYSST